MYGTALINRARRGPDGRSAWELRKGRPCRRQLAMFGEKCLWLKKDKRKSGPDSGFQLGFVYGVVEGRDQVCTGTPDGAFPARSFKRLPEEARCDGAGFMKCVGVHWQPVPGQELAAGTGPLVLMDAPAAVPNLPEGPARDVAAAPRAL